MAAPTTEELVVLKEFRNEMSDVEAVAKCTDLQCLAWLRARDLDIPKASEMWRKSLEWRKEEDVDNVLAWEPPSNYLSDYDYEIVGVDDEGRPVAIIPLGEWDLRKVTSAGETKTVARYIDQLFERLMEKSRESSVTCGTEVTQFVAIFDMANFSMRQLTSFVNVNTILQMVQRFEANYPETLCKAYVVNSSRVFQILFAMVKPLLSARTLSKVEIYTKPDKWQPVLLDNLPISILPPEFGGFRSGRRISIGHFPNRDRSLTERLSTSYITLEVGAGQKFELAFTVTKPGSRITWTFESESYDIGFSINFNKTEQVLPFHRCDSHLNEESGNIICVKPGEYFVTFDNTYSKMRGKMIHYLVDMLESEEDYLHDAGKEA